jgi:catechol 1,2-dioxygenase
MATQSAILGPFFRHDTPTRENGSSISLDTPADAEVVYMHGTVLDAVTKKPLENASVHVWEASTNGEPYYYMINDLSTDAVRGLYSQQDESQIEHNLHGKFITDAQGKYEFYCLRPTPYPIPFDGPAGKILQLLDRHPYRPAHIHLIVSKVF